MAKKKASTILAIQSQVAKRQESGWDKAIEDARARISNAERYIAGLQESISTFQQLKDGGEPFPGEVPKAKAA